MRRASTTPTAKRRTLKTADGTVLSKPKMRPLPRLVPPGALMYVLPNAARRGPGILNRVKGVVGSAKRGVERSAEVMSGADIRRFEEFTDAATTAIVGVHQDQAELRERLDASEQSLDELQQGQAKLAEGLTSVERSITRLSESEESSASSLSPWTIAFGAMSVAALLLSVVAVVVAVS